MSVAHRTVATEIWLTFLEGMVVEFVRRSSEAYAFGEVIHSHRASGWESRPGPCP